MCLILTKVFHKPKLRKNKKGLSPGQIMDRISNSILLRRKEAFNVAMINEVYEKEYKFYASDGWKHF